MRKLWLISLVLLVGCTVRFPQVERIQQYFSESSNPLDPILWLATIGDTTQEVVAVIAKDGGNVFVNKDGVLLHYDAFIVRKIELFNERIRHLEYRDISRFGSIERQLWWEYKPSEKMLCKDWLVVSKGVSEQVCEQNGRALVNRRVLNAQNELIELHQALGSEGLVLTLKKKIT